MNADNQETMEKPAVPIRYRLANALVTACYGVAGLSVASIAIGMLTDDRETLWGAYVAVVYALMILYPLGLTIGFIRRPHVPSLPILYASAFLAWILETMATGDVTYLEYEVGVTLLAILTIVSGHALRNKYEPVRRAADIPDVPPSVNDKG